MKCIQLSWRQPSPLAFTFTVGSIRRERLVQCVVHLLHDTCCTVKQCSGSAPRCSNCIGSSGGAGANPIHITKDAPSKVLIRSQLTRLSGLRHVMEHYKPLKDHAPQGRRVP